jgi:hypothetical protein
MGVRKLCGSSVTRNLRHHGELYLCALIQRVRDGRQRSIDALCVTDLSLKHSKKKIA